MSTHYSQAYSFPMEIRDTENGGVVGTFYTVCPPTKGEPVIIAGQIYLVIKRVWHFEPNTRVVLHVIPAHKTVTEPVWIAE